MNQFDIGMGKVSPTDYRGYELFHEGTLAFMDIESNGLAVDTRYCKRESKRLQRQMDKLEVGVMRHPDVRAWKRAKGRHFKLTSGDQLAWWLFDDEGLGLKSPNTTDKGKASVDQASLEMLGLSWINDLVSIRKLDKVKGTYLEGFLREQVDGIMRPSFNLHIARTFRSSSSNPNFQNIPKRDKVMKAKCRRAVVPRPGHMIGELDYSGVEVRVGACYHKDPVMINYIMDPSTDMHRDMAMEIYKLKQTEMMKNIRQEAKNKFVFPEFYGDWWKSCALQLHRAINDQGLVTAQGVPLHKHLAKNKIKNLGQFEKHIEEVERAFWYDRFKIYTEWKERHLAEYEKTGYFDLLTGFRCSGVMGRNDVINYPVQGAAFHCLLWSVIQLNKWLKANRMETMIVGQIHDSIVLDFAPGEFNAVVKAAMKIMTKDIRKVWPWLIVPLDVEIELTPKDGPWDTMNDVVGEGSCTDCGMDWRFKKKAKDDPDDFSYIYTCPTCGDEELKEAA